MKAARLLGTQMQKGKDSRARLRPQPHGDGAHHDAMIGVLMQFRVVVRSIKQHYRSVERTCGVSGAQLWALAQVAASPGMKVGDLAVELAVHQSTASNIVDKLEVARLVERRRLQADRWPNLRG